MGLSRVDQKVQMMWKSKNYAANASIYFSAREGHPRIEFVPIASFIFPQISTPHLIKFPGTNRVRSKIALSKTVLTIILIIDHTALK